MTQADLNKMTVSQLSELAGHLKAGVGWFSEESDKTAFNKLTTELQVVENRIECLLDELEGDTLTVVYDVEEFCESTDHYRVNSTHETMRAAYDTAQSHSSNNNVSVRIVRITRDVLDWIEV